MSTFKTRLITGIFIVAVYAIMYFLGATAVTAFTTLMMLFAIVELRNAFKNIDVKINYVPIMIAVFLKAALSYVIKTFESTSFLIPFEQLIFAILVLTLFITYIFDLTEKRLLNFGMSLMTALYIVYIGTFFSNYTSENHHYFLVIFAITTGADVFAYLGGSLFGKKKLCPKVSPKKTVEGAACGLLGAIGLGLIPIHFLFPSVKIDIKLIAALLILGILAELGDLFASGIKRATGIKDYGDLLPGHGGILDRFDSLLFVSFGLYIIFIEMGIL